MTRRPLAKAENFVWFRVVWWKLLGGVIGHNVLTIGLKKKSNLVFDVETMVVGICKNLLASAREVLFKILDDQMMLLE